MLFAIPQAFSPPLASLCPGAPPRSASARYCGVGAGRRFCGALWMHGYSAVPECGMEVVFVRCRRLLKYIIYEILHRKERKGRKAGAV